jgi:type IV pilus assembly protein PilV
MNSFPTIPSRGTPTPNKGEHGRIQAQAGVGLIEVMVAVLILSIGFLGVGALLATSLSTNNSAMARSMATVSSYSILDAMRADYTNATGGLYNTATPLAANACPADSTTNLVANQLHTWCAQLGQNLGATASTTGNINCLASGECTITIQFDDSRSGDGGASDQTIVTKGML